MNAREGVVFPLDACAHHVGTGAAPIGSRRSAPRSAPAGPRPVAAQGWLKGRGSIFVAFNRCVRTDRFEDFSFALACSKTLVLGES
jgi:hypothetical protein